MKMLTLLLTAFTLSSCAHTAVARNISSISLSDVSVVADPDANLSSATSLDIVVIYDRAVVEQLPKTGPEWFANKQSLLEAVGRSLDVVSLQVPPSTQLPVRMPPRSRNAVAVFAYANYFSEMGQPVGVLTSYRKVVIHLLLNSVEYNGN